jgi:Asp/Glu/hydantoin racemase
MIRGLSRRETSATGGFLFALALVGFTTAASNEACAQGKAAQLGSPSEPKSYVGNGGIQVFRIDEYPVKAGGKVIRTISLYRGRTPHDQETPGHVTYYYLPILDLVLAPPGPNRPDLLPEFVHEVHRDGTTTYLTFVFRLSSEKMDAACRSIIERLPELQLERKKIGAEPVVEVKPAKIFDLVIAVQDALSGLTLSQGQMIVAGAGEDVTLTMAFDPDTLALFRERADQGKIRFQPVYLPNGQQISRAVRTTAIRYNLGLKAASKLTTHQARGTMPIFKANIDQIAKKLDGEIWVNASYDTASVATLYQSQATQLIGSVFTPDRDVSIDTITRENSGFDAAVVAEYLKPIIRSVSDSLTDYKSVEKNVGKEEMVMVEIGGGFSLPFFGASGSAERHNRAFEMLTEASGVQFVKGSRETQWIAKAVTVYKLAEGYQKQVVNEVSSVVLGQGAISNYLIDSPFDQRYTTRLVDASLEETLNRSVVTARQLSERFRGKTDILVKEAERAAWETALSAEAKKVDAAQARLVAAYDDPALEQAIAGTNGCSGVYGMIMHSYAIGWGGWIKDGGEKDRRAKDRDEAATREADIRAKRTATVNAEKTAIRSGLDGITAYAVKLGEGRKYIEERRAKIDAINTTLTRSVNVNDIVARRRELQAAIEAKEDERAALVAELVAEARKVDAAQSQIVAAYDDPTVEIAIAGHNGCSGLVGFIDHAKAIGWGDPPDGGERARRVQDRDAAAAREAEARSKRASAVNGQKPVVRSGLDVIAARAAKIEEARKYIEERQVEIDGIDNKLISLGGR